MRVLLWGTYDTGKPRVRILCAGMRAVGIDLEEIHTAVWEGVEDKSQVKKLSSRLRLLARWALAYPWLIWRLATAPKPDLLLIGFPGIMDMLVAAPIARLRGIPLAWDMFMSLYDTIVEDRQLTRRNGCVARFLHTMEGFALRRADLVFLDTQTHARRIETLFNLEPGSVGAIWVGAETECFHADLVETNIRTAADTASDVCVLFYGQFIPLHGIETIVHAARIARDEPIQWQLIGSGQETNRIKALLAEQALPKLHWDSWVDYKQLSHRIAAADVCLGIFGTSEKAASVIPNKVFQIVAMGRPLITRDSPAIRELLDDAPPCVYLIPAADPAALVTSIRDFSRQSRSAMRCHTALQGKLDALAIGQQCATLLKSHLGLES